MAEIPRLIRSSERSRDTAQTGGMVREEAARTDGMWAGYVRTAAGMVSGWHHHGEFETAIFVVRGSVRFECGPGGGTVFDARPGDFIHVPRSAIHRETNPEATESELVVVRAGHGAPVVNVDGPE